MSTVRNAAFDDLPQIKQLALAAWLNAYAGIFSEEQIRAENDKFHTEAFHRLLLERTSAGKHLFKVAESEGTVVGLMDFDFGDKTWLTRFYVSPELIGKGVGKELMNTSEAELLALGRARYYLLVHQRNRIGIAFYERNGFVRFPKFDQEADEEICYEKTIG